jgi:hypothetical protein
MRSARSRRLKLESQTRLAGYKWTPFFLISTSSSENRLHLIAVATIWIAGYVRRIHVTPCPSPSIEEIPSPTSTKIAICISSRKKSVLLISGSHRRINLGVGRQAGDLAAGTSGTEKTCARSEAQPFGGCRTFTPCCPH